MSTLLRRLACVLTIALAALLVGCAPEAPTGPAAGAAGPTVQVRHEPLPDPFPPSGDAGSVWAVDERGWASQQALEKGLAARLPKLELDGADLVDALAQLARAGQFNLHVRWEVLKHAKIDRKSAVNVRLADVTVEQALWTVLQDVGGLNPLGFEVCSGLVTVSTKDDLFRQTVTRVYDVRDIIAALRGATAGQTHTLQQPSEGGGIFGENTVVEEFPMTRVELVDSLLEVIRGSIEPETWRGGESPGMVGSVRELGGKLIMTHTPSTHRRVHQLLEAFRGRTDRVPAPAPPKAPTSPTAAPAAKGK